MVLIPPTKASRRRLAHAAAFGFAVLSTASPPPSAAAQLTEALHIRGPITQNVAETTMRELTEHPRALAVTSSGGDARAALLLGEFIQKHHVSVTAAGYCLSACASYVWVASPSPKIAPATIIGFHDTMTSMMSAARGRDPAFAVHTYGELSEREVRLYRAAHIDPALLTLPAVMMAPRCDFLATGPSGEQVALVASQFVMYVPSEATLRKAGLKFAGAIAATADEIGVAARTNLPQALGMRVRVDVPGDTTLEGGRLAETLTQVPACPAEVQSKVLAGWRPAPR